MQRHPPQAAVLAREILGEAVGCFGSDEMGRIVDLVVERTSGRVCYAIVEPADVLERESGRLLAIPWRALAASSTSERLLHRLHLTLTYLKSAPVFDAEDLPDFADSHAMAEVHAFYGEPPWLQR